MQSDKKKALMKGYQRLLGMTCVFDYLRVYQTLHLQFRQRRTGNKTVTFGKTAGIPPLAGSNSPPQTRNLSPIPFISTRFG
jgi:hypothetical protein